MVEAARQRFQLYRSKEAYWTSHLPLHATSQELSQADIANFRPVSNPTLLS